MRLVLFIVSAAQTIILSALGIRPVGYRVSIIITLEKFEKMKVDDTIKIAVLLLLLLLLSLTAVMSWNPFNKDYEDKTELIIANYIDE